MLCCQLAKMPHILVATPGRLAAIIQSGASTLRLSGVKYVVLDEADRLLDTTIAPDLDVILAALPPAGSGRQTLLFSATYSKNVTRAQQIASVAPFTWSATVEVS